MSMNENMLEIIIEGRMDSLDERLLSGKLSQEEYEQAVRDLDAEFKPKIAKARALANIQF